MKRSITVDSILSLRPAFFSLALLSKVYDSQAYCNMDMTREHISFTFNQRYVVISLNWLQLCMSCSGSEALEAYGIQLLPFYLALSLDDISTVCHHFDLFSTDLLLIPCVGFVETVNQGF